VCDNDAVLARSGVLGLDVGTTGVKAVLFERARPPHPVGRAPASRCRTTMPPWAGWSRRWSSVSTYSSMIARMRRSSAAALWAVAVGVLLLVRGPFRIDRDRRTTMRADIAEGLRFLWRNSLPAAS
jgi:hypothetical protein